jgi:hypothetical protein
MTEDLNTLEPEDSGEDLPNVFQDVQAEEPVAADIDTVAFAILYPTGGQPVHLPISDPGNPPTITEAIQNSGLTTGGSTQYWVDGAQVDPMTTRIADNMTISAVGNVKGG